jgi:uncharacterized transporter YbjL
MSLRISRGGVFVNKLLRSLLKTGVFLLEQSDQATAEVRDRMREGTEDISSRTRQAMRSPQSYVARDILTFAAGMSLGLGLGILFAPAPGYQTRNTIADKMEEVGNKVRGRFAPEAERAAG